MNTRCQHNTGKSLTGRTYPTSGMSFLAAMGKTTPPALEPMLVSPNAMLFRVLNHCEMTLIEGPIIAPHVS